MTTLEPAAAATDPAAARAATSWMLAPATRLLWRSPTAIHLELGSRAVVVEGLPAPVITAVASRRTEDPHRGLAPQASQALAEALDDDTSHALASLAEAGYLWPRPGAGPKGEPGGDERLHIPGPLLGPEFGALTAAHGTAANRVLSTRRASSVALYGAGRVSAHLGAVLAAAGVGRVHCAAGGGTTLVHHAVPGGTRPADEGQLLAHSAEHAIRAAAPDTDTRAPDPDERPDLTVLALGGPANDDHVRSLHAANAAYLAVTLGVDHGVVGPLVLPGMTSCLRCADLHRLDRDPAWNALATQLTVPRRHGPASDVATATTITGLAARQALDFLDGGEPAVLDATLEIRLPDWRVRRRSWPPHPNCECVQIHVPSG